MGERTQLGQGECGRLTVFPFANYAKLHVEVIKKDSKYRHQCHFWSYFIMENCPLKTVMEARLRKENGFGS